MARPSATLDELFDRPYRPGAVFGPRIGRLRRWGMMLFLMLLVSIICGYWYLTDSRRVRAMAESYLSRLTGRYVNVKSATLSIFEGLRLDGVTIRMDPGGQDDSRIFHAQTILIRYDPQSLLSRKLEATQIIALDPQVFLCENLDEKRWNFQPKVGADTGLPREPATAPVKFPEILLRNVQINYSRIRNGKIQSERGVLEIEGNIRPEDDKTLAFSFQSRGTSRILGPIIRGSAHLDTREVEATLENFTFGPDIEVMLPEQVRNWCREHSLQGALDINRFVLQPATRDLPMRFEIRTHVEGVKLKVMPEESLSGAEGQRLAAMRRAFAFMKTAGLDATGAVGDIERSFNPVPIELERVKGDFLFTEKGITIEKITGELEENRFEIRGSLSGYKVQGPMSLTIEGKSITIPDNPKYLDSLPPQVREMFVRMRPYGHAWAWLKIDRQATGAKPVISGEVEVVDGHVKLDEFPYPLRNVRGRITFGWDEATRMDRLDIRGLRGYGVKGGPNENVAININGFAAPLEDSEVRVIIQAQGVSSEPELNAAFPKNVKEALEIFDAHKTGRFPEFKGGLTVYIDRPRGPNQNWTVNVDVDLERARGVLTFFPYPIENMRGKLRIEGYHTLLRDVRFGKGDAEIMVDGIVRYGKGKPTIPQIHVTTRNLPIDKDLLGALPPDARKWLVKLGVMGQVNVEGRIDRDFSGPDAMDPVKVPITYDLNVHLRDGAIWPGEGGTFAVSDLSGQLHLKPGQIVLNEMRGTRGKSAVTGGGLLSWSEAKPRIALTVSAKGLMLEPALYKLLPPSWRNGWDQARPEGTVDADFSYTGTFEDSDAPATRPGVPATGPAATALRDAKPDPDAGFQAVLTPVKLSVTPKIIPTRLDDLKGRIVIRPDGVMLREVVGTRKTGGTIAISGAILADRQAMWDLKLAGQDLVIDKDLKAALPAAVSKLITGLEIEGKMSVKFDTLTYRPSTDEKTDDGEIDLAGTVTLPGNSFNIGMPVTDASGTLALKAQARKGRLGGFTGSLDLASLKLAGREVTNLKADLIKPEQADALRVGKIAGEIAGGELAGQVDLVFPDNGASRFGLGLVLRNADVKTLTGPAEKDIKGRLTASLSLEGNWGDPATRRGRGDVQVMGKEMYKIPLVLGLVQITNLTLPISSPFSEAAARYTVDGQRINFEQIELRASNILMSGNGWLDFATRKVKMTFYTDNPNAWKIPFLHELIQGARQEFLQIHVSGTVQEPRVTGSTMNTFTTTIDEVLKGKEKGRK